MKSMLLLLFSMFSGLALGASYTKTDNILSSSGGPVYFPAGLAGAAGAALPLPAGVAGSGGGVLTVPAGITTPITAIGDFYDITSALTLTAGTNVAAVVTPVTLNCTRAGNIMRCFGQVSIDPTSATTLSAFTLSLPTRAANFTGTSGAAGTATAPAAVAAGSCVATNGAKTVTCTYTSGGTAVELVSVQFSYVLVGN